MSVLAYVHSLPLDTILSYVHMVFLRMRYILPLNNHNVVEVFRILVKVVDMLQK